MSLSDPALPRVGVLLPTREQVLSGAGDARTLLQFGQAAERLGFDSLWCGDSLLARPRLEPLALLAALAGATEEILLGTAVLLGPLRHPLLLAHQVASLDQLAEGRLIIGMGSGFPYPATEAEFAAVGVPFGSRNGRLLELVEICRLLWREAGQPVSFSGQHFALTDVSLQPKPSQPGGPAIWLAGESEQGLVRAGAVYDGWLPYSPSAPLYAERLGRVIQSANAAGRAGPTAALYCTINLDDDPQRAESELDAYVQAYYGFPLEVMGQLQAFYGGDAAGCVEWLASYIEAGACHLVVRIGSLTRHREKLDAIAAIAAAIRTRQTRVPGGTEATR